MVDLNRDFFPNEQVVVALANDALKLGHSLVPSMEEGGAD